MRHIFIVVFPGVNLLDVAGPTQVFTTASEMLAAAGSTTDRAYRVSLISTTGGLVASTSGVELNSEPLTACEAGALDTLLIAGGAGAETAHLDPKLASWLKTRGRGAGRLGSICTGAFVLARAGLLDGRRAATHWDYCARLAHEHPTVVVDRDAIFVHDRGVWTSAGVTSGIDLALAMVEEDWGRDLSLLVSRQLVVFLKRSGGQSQFSVQLKGQLANGPLAGLVAWVAENPTTDLRVERLAERAGKSQRTLHRLFQEVSGASPAQWVEKMRLETARRRLEDTTDPLERVAALSGFGSADTMRRIFMRHLSVAPSAYRERFRRDPAASPPALQIALHKRDGDRAET